MHMEELMGLQKTLSLWNPLPRRSKLLSPGIARAVLCSLQKRRPPSRLRSSQSLSIRVHKRSASTHAQELLKLRPRKPGSRARGRMRRRDHIDYSDASEGEEEASLSSGSQESGSPAQEGRKRDKGDGIGRQKRHKR